MQRSYFIAWSFTASVSFPPAVSFPQNLKQLKGSIRFIAAYNYAITKDSTGRQIASIADKSFISFHPSGNNIITECYGATGRVTEYHCLYDSLERMVQMDIIFERIYATKYTHKFDKKNREIETKSYNGISTPYQTETYTYPYGTTNVVIQTIRSSMGYIDTSIATLYYDTLKIDWSNGRRHDEEANVTNFYNGIHSQSISKYNQYNDVITQKSYKGDSLMRSLNHHYMYDSFGNWTVDSLFSNNTFSNIITRKIEYWQETKQ